jgi:hypothetical protein
MMVPDRVLPAVWCERRNQCAALNAGTFNERRPETTPAQ